MPKLPIIPELADPKGESWKWAERTDLKKHTIERIEVEDEELSLREHARRLGAISISNRRPRLNGLPADVVDACEAYRVDSKVLHGVRYGRSRWHAPSRYMIDPSGRQRLGHEIRDAMLDACDVEMVTYMISKLRMLARHDKLREAAASIMALGAGAESRKVYEYINNAEDDEDYSDFQRRWYKDLRSLIDRARWTFCHTPTGCVRDPNKWRWRHTIEAAKEIIGQIERVREERKEAAKAAREAASGAIPSRIKGSYGTGRGPKRGRADRLQGRDWSFAGKQKPGMPHEFGMSDHWGVMEIMQPPRGLVTRSGAFARVNGAGDSGTAVRQPYRMETDMMVFARKRHVKGGTLLFDVSGSMGVDEDDIEKLLRLAPAALIATYCGAAHHGWLTIIARNGKRCKREHLTPRSSGNTVDGPALGWLARQLGPRVWVSDGHVVGRSGGQPSNDMYEEIEKLMLRYNVVRVLYPEDAGLFLRGKLSSSRIHRKAHRW